MKKSKLILVSIVLILVMLFSMVSCDDEARKSGRKDTDVEDNTSASSEKPGEGDENKESDGSNGESEGSKDTEKKPSSSDSYANKTYQFSEIEDKLKLLGRTQVTNDGIQCDFTASGVEFKAYIRSSFRFTVYCDRDTYFTVFVDGQRMGGAAGRYLAKGKTDTTIMISGLGDIALHEVRILKQTEPQYSLSILKKLNFYGALEGPADQKDMYIEFLGDSITCGYGNLIADNVDDKNAYKAVNSDGTRAYAFLTAEKLNADSSIISCSGIGVDNGWTMQSDTDYLTKLEYYSKASYFRNNKTVQDFSKLRVPDVVVINLGTNDNSRASEETEFKHNVKALIDFIRASYGKDMPIVWAYNMMGACCADWTKAVLSELGGESARLYSIQLNENRTGGNGHPNLAAHEMAATTLANFIKTIPLDTANQRLHYNRIYTLDACAPLVKQVGRTAIASDGLICDYTASGIEFKAYIKGNLKFTVNCNKDTYFTVMVDGNRLGPNTGNLQSDLRFKATGGSDVTIDVGNLGNTAALHEIRILKQTEPQNSLCVMKSVQFNGVLDSAAAEKDLYIEFLGDSITCGYGNLIANGGANPGSALNQDGTRTYAFLAAEKLGADASVISCSGIGIDKGFTGMNEAAFYPKASYFRNNTQAYDFSTARIPDVVVINLGTNDDRCGSTEQQFKNNVEALINTIRTSYGKDIPIVWGHNMMSACCFEWTSAVLAKMGGTGAGLYSVQLNANHNGGNGHPTLQAQIDNSTILANFIKDNVLK